MAGGSRDNDPGAEGPGDHGSLGSKGRCIPEEVAAGDLCSSRPPLRQEGEGSRVIVDPEVAAVGAAGESLVEVEGSR